ncbi:MAG TPA: DUF2339 domain-containing protein [Pyrinomonadaceae bacterium]|nr:DUF2339 domain-containing protein [Pyrinomonadaceae bacterium]
MEEFDDKIAQLQARLENLVRTQISFQQEITQIRSELNFLRGGQPPQNEPQQTPRKPSVREYVPPPRNEPPPIKRETNQQTNQETKTPNFGYSNNTKSEKPPFENTVRPFPTAPKVKSEIEKFIGENLISKIGIVILVIGVAIGAKYAIDKNLISPATRIFLGYLFGFGLLGLALKLKAKYLNFSAVLLSGAMAIMYFITYFAYSLYGLFSQSAAFALMIFFTVFTVVAAINYSRQIIAHLGLVGAYAVPFLLSDNSGNYAFLFAYITIINGGILAISLKKYWKPLFYTSFVFTWVIFYGWYLTSFKSAEHFNLAFLFLTIFFLIFYVTFIAYKVITDENIALENVTLVLSNSFIFYGLGFSLLDHQPGFENYLGMFTVANAAIHFAFAFTISRLKLFPTDLVYLLTALIITFATIAIPVQLDGNRVTLIWTVEAAILFWIGRTKEIPIFQYFSFPLMILAFTSLLQDWLIVEQSRGFGQNLSEQLPLLNGNFVTSLLFAIAFGFIFYTNKDERSESVLDETLRKPFGYIIAAIGLGVLYNCFRIEIANYFAYLTVKTALPKTIPPNIEMQRYVDKDLEFFNVVWQINYTMLFLSVLSFINIKRFKNFVLAYANLYLNAFALFIFLTAGLYFLSELRESYLIGAEPQYFVHGSFNVLIRYISYAFCALLLFACYRYIKQKFLLEKLAEDQLILAFDFVFYISILIIASSELLNLMNIFGYRDSYKLGLSILWGIYALGLIVLGIYGHKKHLRIGAIVLFALTLAKIFFYDIADLNTISKTIVFVSLGILMLIVSFLYNKYKSLIFDTTES